MTTELTKKLAHELNELVKSFNNFEGYEDEKDNKNFIS